MEAHILVVDDDAAIRELIREYLSEHDFKVSMAESGAEMDKVLGTSEMVDLVILDLKLPDEDGLAIARRLRESLDLPIIILTGRKEEADRIMGLELGADDYVTKPFSVRELVSRVRAHLRRAEMSGSRAGSDGTLHAGPVELDAAQHEVRVRGELVPMPPKEFALLEMLLRLKGRLLTRDHLIAEVWGADYFGDTKTLDVHMKRLRQKIEEDPHQPTHLLTVRGLGYRFVD
jgi:two-component system response regulator RegX3